MADKKISGLTSAGALAGTEPVPIVQGGVTVKTTVQDIADLATPDLQQVLDAGSISTTGLEITDGTNSVAIKEDQIKIVNALADAVITSPTLATTTEFRIPNKATNPQTFAMLSDIPSGGVASVSSGTNINVDNTDPANPIINSLSDRYKTTSVTSNTIGNGSKTFTVDANLSYITLQEVLIVFNASNHMHGTVTSYSGTTLVVDIKHNTGSGTYTLWSINLDGTPVDAITGSGTANRLAYFTAAQVIDDLDTATYPSLTELSYVKGVTSNIQTQINSLSRIASVGDGTAVTGTTNNTLCKTLTLSANARGANDAPIVFFQIKKTGTAGGATVRLYWNTTASLTGAILLASTGSNNTATQFTIRHLGIEVADGTGNGTQVFNATTAANNPYGAVAAALTTAAINWTVSGFLIVAIQNASTADSSNCNIISLT
jgi:hypothetical protein